MPVFSPIKPPSGFVSVGAIFTIIVPSFLSILPSFDGYVLPAGFVTAPVSGSVISPSPSSAKAAAPRERQRHAVRRRASMREMVFLFIGIDLLSLEMGEKLFLGQF